MDMKTAPLSLLNDPTLLKTDSLINGQWVAGTSRFDVNDPATGKKLADVANLGPADAEAAIAAANTAWGPWKAKTGKERSAACWSSSKRLACAQLSRLGTFHWP